MRTRAVLKSSALATAICTALLVAAAGCSRATREPTVDKAKPVEREAMEQTVVVDERDAQPRDGDRRRVQTEEKQKDDYGVAQPGVTTMSAAPPKLAEAPELMAAPATGYAEAANRENYADRADNPVFRAAETPVSTFSIDVDTGSYSNVRRMLNQGTLPPADAVRAEEFLNYFDYAYQPPATLDTPFSVRTEVAPAPWNAQRHLFMVGIKGFEPAAAQIPASNLVFLIDTSGSMESPDKIHLLKEAFKRMVPSLRAQDRVSIVVYAGSAGLVLPPTAGDDHATIVAALDQLSAGGSTNGGAGIELAYTMARQAYIDGGVNRVILATDGDFNVGTTDIEALKTLVADKRKSGVALTTLGFGQGNYNDELAEQLADIGNGNHFYIDTLSEGRKVLVDELTSTMLTIAKDVKIQVEFNPAVVAEYRLIGYENRMLRREDFNNDAIDAGEIGAGHDVTALYELTLVGSPATRIEPLRYSMDVARNGATDELAHLRLRYKAPSSGGGGGDASKLIERPVRKSEIVPTPSDTLAFAAAVAAFADQLRGGANTSGYGLERIAALAEARRGNDPFGYRAELVQLVRTAASLQTPAHAGATEVATRE